MRCAILVLPSRSEAMGRVLIEAAAAGKARVASAVGGTYTVIEDGRDGLLVPRSDPDALADALRRLISDADLRSKLGDAARVRAETEFNEQSYLDHVTEFVTTVLATHTR
jgi:glycosyltransferase involved in cell wall biosynthesis